MCSPHFIFPQVNDKDKFDVFMRLVDKVDALWGAHHVVNVGLIGGLVVYGMSRVDAVSLLAFVLILLYINVWNAYALLRVYKFLTLILWELQQSATLQENVSDQLRKALLNLRFGRREWHIVLTHLVFPVGSIWLGLLFAK